MPEEERMTEFNKSNWAMERLEGFKNIRFTRTSFQEILERDILDDDFDFIVSSLAIHHLSTDEKRVFSS